MLIPREIHEKRHARDTNDRDFFDERHQAEKHFKFFANYSSKHFTATVFAVEAAPTRTSRRISFRRNARNRNVIFTALSMKCETNEANVLFKNTPYASDSLEIDRTLDFLMINA